MIQPMLAVKYVILLSLMSGVSSSAFASETDQYFAWGKAVPDSTKELNKFYNKIMANVIANVNSKTDRKQYSCERVASFISKNSVREAHLIELFPWRVEGVYMVPGTPAEILRFRSESMYGNPDASHIRLLTSFSGPTIEVNSVRHGTDKPQHFFGTGYRYFQTYLKAKAEGASEEEALIKSIEYGIETENGVLGLKVGGVFSPGDLEANFQGSEFYRDLCTRENPLLTQDSQGEFSVRVPGFDWKQYVNPYWDES